MNDYEFMIDCINCNLSYKAYVALCQEERRIWVTEETYDGCAK
jgi:hypothetical protein